MERLFTKQISYSIDFISASETYNLRQKILRPGQNISASSYPEDFSSSTFHLGALVNDNNKSSTNKIIGISTFIQAQHPDFLKAEKSYRLRGMAVDSEFQKKNVGSSILIQAELHLKQKQCSLLWFNARQSAFYFYESLGFKFHGDLFEIADIGPHKVMYKWL